MYILYTCKTLYIY